MAIRTITTSFVTGELSPRLYGRTDVEDRLSGVATCRNALVLPQGTLKKRPGFEFIQEAAEQLGSNTTRLIPFRFSTEDVVVIEMTVLDNGTGIMYFYINGQPVMNGGGRYNRSHPYAKAELWDVHYVQSNDVMTLVHVNHKPKELKRLSATNWTLTDIAFTSPTTAPTNVVATKQGGDGKSDDTRQTYKYVVTTLTDDRGLTESAASAVATVDANLYQSSQSVKITWDAVGGATRYNVYKMEGGLYGYIGQAEGVEELVDDNIDPDLEKTPPRYDSLFASSTNYPASVTYFEQRRWFGGTLREPQNIWATVSGTESRMAYSLPLRSDDRVSFQIASREMNFVRHMVGLRDLLVLTNAAEWRVTSNSADAITPTNINVSPQSYVGARNVQPQVVNNAALYAEDRGSHIREIRYNENNDGFISGDISLFAEHLFIGKQVLEMAYSKTPTPVLWVVTVQGTLLGLTFCSGR